MTDPAPITRSDLAWLLGVLHVALGFAHDKLILTILGGVWFIAYAVADWRDDRRRAESEPE